MNKLKGGVINTRGIKPTTGGSRKSKKTKSKKTKSKKSLSQRNTRRR